MKARIGIPVPTFRDFDYNRTCSPDYADAVRAAGGEPVEIPLTGADPSLLAGCAGYVLPGSPADVLPSLYGQVAAATTAGADPEREVCDQRILELAQTTGRPVLGICYGAQFLNVWRGGTLVQDLSPLPVNHAAGAQVATAHSTLVASQTLLGSLLSQSEAPAAGQYRRLPVNSSHHQAIAIPGDDLTVIARASEDGVIEAVEGFIGQSPMIGVQWHPERSVGISAASRALFQWVVLAATDYAERAEESIADIPD